MNTQRFLALAILALLAGCASSSNGTGPIRDRNLITQDEIAETAVANAYQAVERLRPRFLRVRGQRTIYGESTGVVVYVDGSRLGGVDSLHGVPIDDVLEIRFIDGAEATTRWGTGHPDGAILVTTRRGR